MSDPIRLVHLADLHLGCTMPANLIRRADEPAAGRSVRETDLEQAVRTMTSGICSQQPPVDLVVVAGDLFHRATPSPRAVDAAARMVRDLTRSGAEVVLADGNHDNTAARIQTGSPLSFLRYLGARVVNGADAITIGTTKPWTNPRLRGRLAVTAVPFDAVRQGRFAGVRPVGGLLTVLVIHGRVSEGGLPDTNTLHERIPDISTEVLRRGWDYVALGEWHEHRRQPVAGLPAYYAGSLEALTFREATVHPPKRDDPWATGGAIKVTLIAPGIPAEVSSLPNPHRRPVLRLKAIEAEGMDGAALTDALEARLRGLPAEAMVTLRVEGCRSQAWKEVDWAAIDELRARVRRCEIVPVFAVQQTPELALTTLSLDAQWRDFLASQDLSPEDQALLADLGLKRISVARNRALERDLEQGLAVTAAVGEE